MQLNVPLFEGGAVNSRIRQAGHDYEAARERLIATRRSVKRQAKDAFRGVLSSIGRGKALKTSVISVERALEATKAANR